MLALLPLAPLGAIILSLFLAVAVCYAAVYARLYHCFGSGQRSLARSEALENVETNVDMLGLHIEDEPGAAITIKDQQHTHQQAVLQFFRSYGYRNNNIYTTFSNPEMRVLLLPGVGCMVYTTAAHWGLKVVVATGDPVCEPQHDLLMLQTFKAAFPAGAMLDLSKDVAMLWVGEEAQQPGPSMTVTDMGTETVVNVQSYDFEFNKRTKEIRRNAEKATRAGLVVEEVDAHSSAAVKEQVQQLAAEWQQGKQVTDDLKVFSRTIPFQHLGRERDVRVFIARTLEPGEAAPFTVAMATQQLEKQKAAAAAKLAATSAAMAEGETIRSSPAPGITGKQRRKNARAQRARQQQQQQQQPQEQQQQHPQQQQQCTIVADSVAAAPSPPPPPPPPPPADMDRLDLITHVACNIQELSDQHHRQQQKQKQQLQQETASSPAVVGCGSSGSTDGCGSSSSSSTGGCGSSGSGLIHACVMLDPIYRDGEVVGYFVQRTFLSPRGVQGAPKLVLKEVLGLLKAEGRAILNHGPAATHNVKSGAFHGFTDCAWIRHAFRLCWEYGNSLYAFKNLAMAKSSWGGGYSPEDDGLKYKGAVTLNRRFVLLPPSWSCPLSHGPLLLLVVFRHVGLLGDPWELFAFWRYW